MIGAEGLFAESLTASLVAGILILAMLVAAVAYGWHGDARAQRRMEGQPFRKAA